VEVDTKEVELLVTAASKALVSSLVMGSLLVDITVKSAIRLPEVNEFITI